MSGFHRRTSLVLVLRNRIVYIHEEARPQRGIHEVEIRGKRVYHAADESEIQDTRKRNEKGEALHVLNMRQGGKS